MSTNLETLLDQQLERLETIAASFADFVFAVHYEPNLKNLKEEKPSDVFYEAGHWCSEHWGKLNLAGTFSRCYSTSKLLTDWDLDFVAEAVVAAVVSKTLKEFQNAEEA